VIEPFSRVLSASGGAKVKRRVVLVLAAGFVALFAYSIAVSHSEERKNDNHNSNFLGSAEQNSQQLIVQGRQIFRFDTFLDSGCGFRSA
jgi:hypothetical protein